MLTFKTTSTENLIYCFIVQVEKLLCKNEDCRSNKSESVALYLHCLQQMVQNITNVVDVSENNDFELKKSLKVVTAELKKALDYFNCNGHLSLKGTKILEGSTIILNAVTMLLISLDKSKIREVQRKFKSVVKHFTIMDAVDTDASMRIFVKNLLPQVEACVKLIKETMNTSTSQIFHEILDGVMQKFKDKCLRLKTNIDSLCSEHELDCPQRLSVPPMQRQMCSALILKNFERETLRMMDAASMVLKTESYWPDGCNVAMAHSTLQYITLGINVQTLELDLSKTLTDELIKMILLRSTSLIDNAMRRSDGTESTETYLALLKTKYNTCVEIFEGSDYAECRKSSFKRGQPAAGMLLNRLIDYANHLSQIKPLIDDLESDDEGSVLRRGWEDGIEPTIRGKFVQLKVCLSIPQYFEEGLKLVEILLRQAGQVLEICDNLYRRQLATLIDGCCIFLKKIKGTNKLTPRQFNELSAKIEETMECAETALLYNSTRVLKDPSDPILRISRACLIPLGDASGTIALTGAINSFQKHAIEFCRVIKYLALISEDQGKANVVRICRLVREIEDIYPLVISAAKLHHQNRTNEVLGIFFNELKADYMRVVEEATFRLEEAIPPLKTICAIEEAIINDLQEIEKSIADRECFSIVSYAATARKHAYRLSTLVYRESRCARGMRTVMQLRTLVGDINEVANSLESKTKSIAPRLDDSKLRAELREIGSKLSDSLTRSKEMFEQNEMQTQKCLKEEYDCRSELLSICLIRLIPGGCDISIQMAARKLMINIGEFCSKSNNLIYISWEFIGALDELSNWRSSDPMRFIETKDKIRETLSEIISIVNTVEVECSNDYYVKNISLLRSMLASFSAQLQTLIIMRICRLNDMGLYGG
ncbi:hypothetical protein ACOME3_001509 [Neoechinorhynchus agilis]